ncbi:hypothetical protein EC968_001802 [Mortierella alpina]|nr:hypothetical protein EC968_001802 [Mortierella alpina]
MPSIVCINSAHVSVTSPPASHRDSSRIGRGDPTHHDDSAAAYNRICSALQSLIDAAQSAVQDQTSLLDSSSKVEESGAEHSTPPRLSPWTESLKYSSSNLQLASRSSPRNSLTLLHSTKLDYASHDHLSEFAPAPFYSGTDEVSKIYWRQKHEEQHDRYRKSCQRLTLELEGQCFGSTTESDDSEAGMTLIRRSNAGRPSSAQSATHNTPNQPLQSILRSSKKTARLKKKRQVQFLNADIEVEIRQEPESSEPESSESSPALYRKQQRQKQRQYMDRSVGSTHSRGVVMQLYELWQQTWLRTRIMHVITGSVEVVIIIWVVIRASRATLTWFGIQPASVKEWLAFIYGHRDSTGASAKELYAAIRRDGLQLRQIKAWNRKEPEALVGDLVAGAVASTSLISPSAMVYEPAKKVMAHAVTGVALALFSGGARRLLRKL